MPPTKQKKKARRPRKVSRLPKAVEALLNYLGPPTMGAPMIQQTGPRFASMGGAVEPSKGFATQVAEAVVARQAAMKAARLAAGAEPLKKSLVSTILPPQQQQPTIIVQQPAAAAAAEPSRTQAEEIRKEVMKETGGIERRLTAQLRQQGLEQTFGAIQEAKARKFELGSLPSGVPSEIGRQSAPSFALRGFSESVQGDIESMSSFEPSSASAANLPTVSPQEAAAFQAAQHSQSLATAKLPPAQKLRGRAPAAPKEPKEPKPRGRPKKAAAPPAPTFSQAVGGLAAVAQAQAPKSVSSAASAGSSKSRAREIYESASRQGLSGGDLVYAMAQGGGAAAEPQQVGRSLGELSTSRTRRGMKVVGFRTAENIVEV